MGEDRNVREPSHSVPGETSRREFVALSAATGLAAAAPVSARGSPVVEKDVSIQTPDGTCDAAFIYPATGSHPGVLIWTDIFGLRPTFREFGRRLAIQGYAVLVPNPFYRTQKAPVITEEEIKTFSFQTGRQKMQEWTGPMNAPGAIEKDATAYVGFLDAQRQVSKMHKVGTQGYCMGGPLVVRTAAQVPERVGAGATFHGGGLVTDKPDSPHLLAPKIKAQMYFAIAASDDARQPDAKDKLREAFPTAKVEVFANTFHGWCVPDMPPQQSGMPTYNHADAERAWSNLLALYRQALA
ncbi:MAG TPA: dienelactone hydrolase family protein [Steroidobacteraceae bacterium]|nr:dienelactone hydrolase family protein [Steroidobacteraceae bacterium]